MRDENQYRFSPDWTEPNHYIDKKLTFLTSYLINCTSQWAWNIFFWATLVNECITLTCIWILNLSIFVNISSIHNKLARLKLFMECKQGKHGAEISSHIQIYKLDWKFFIKSFIVAEYENNYLLTLITFCTDAKFPYFSI